MKKAFSLAKRGAGNTSPNPLVGAVVVKNGDIVGQGYHKQYGGPHAEVFALEQAGGRAKGAVLYVNLEPCSHHGKTPPCVDRVIQAGVDRVVISNRDPNPLVDGGGIEKLKAAGIDVTLSVLEETGRKLNEAYFTFITQKRPFVILKWAQSLDGRIATLHHDSSWISNEKSRKIVHELRKNVAAVLVGSGTVNDDNPQLTVRHVKGKQPLRLVLDRHLEINPDSQLLHDPFAEKTVIFTVAEDPEKSSRLQSDGARVIRLHPDRNGNINLNDVTGWLTAELHSSLLVEGGREVLTSFLKAGLADKIWVFIAPKLIGRGIEAVGDLDVRSMRDVIALHEVKIKNIAGDFLYEAYLNR